MTRELIFNYNSLTFRTNDSVTILQIINIEFHRAAQFGYHHNRYTRLVSGVSCEFKSTISGSYKPSEYLQCTVYPFYRKVECLSWNHDSVFQLMVLLSRYDVFWCVKATLSPKLIKLQLIINAEFQSAELFGYHYNRWKPECLNGPCLFCSILFLSRFPFIWQNISTVD